MPTPSSLRLLLALLLLAGLGLASSSAALADGHEGPIIKYRQSVMSTVGTNMGAMSDILKNKLDRPGAIANHAGQMADAAALVGPAFKQNVAGDATDAKPEIWSDWKKFEKAIDDYESAARNLQTAASSGDPSKIGPAMKKLGRSCGGCHKPFRKPKEESYKRR